MGKITDAKINDLVYLKSLNIPGFVCGKGYKCLFDKLADNGSIVCKLIGDPSIYNDKIPTITVKQNHILSIYDHITQAPVYLHDPADGL
jgi:hypothetical protein